MSEGKLREKNYLKFQKKNWKTLKRVVKKIRKIQNKHLILIAFGQKFLQNFTKKVCMWSLKEIFKQIYENCGESP